MNAAYMACRKVAAVLIIKVFKGADLTYLTFIHAKTGAVQLFAKTVTCAMTVIPSYHRSMVNILDSTLHFPFNSECRVPEKRTVVRCIIYEVVGNFPLCANAQVRGDIIP